MSDVTIPYGFEPRDYQLPQYKAMDSGILRAVKCWHRRAGKDLCDWNYLIKRAFQTAGAYWYMFPSLKQGRKALWEGFTKDGKPYLSYIPKELIIGKPNNQEMLIKIHTMSGESSIIRVIDSLPDKSVGAGIKGVVFSEYSLMRPTVWQYIEPMLLENGGWAIFNGTPRGENHFYQMLKMAESNDRWFSQICTVDDTGIITPEQIQQLRDEGRDEEIIQQEYYCSFAGSIMGAYYVREMTYLEKNGMIGNVPYDPNYLVYTAWDIGIGDSTAIWFYQKVDGKVHFIDHEEHTGLGLPKYVEMLQSKPYAYGKHYAPHDIAVRDGWAGSSVPTTRLQQAKKLGINFTVAPKLSIADGINAVRALLNNCKFDKNNVDYGLQCLKQYRKDYNEAKHIFSDKPCHDWTSHTADAMRVAAITMEDNKKKFDYRAFYGG